MADQVVRVGVGVFIIKDGKFLLMQRMSPHGKGTWSVPGGHIEFGESFEDAAKREVKEETGLEITNVRFAAVTNDLYKDEGKHSVAIWLLTDWASGTPAIMEPEKCAKLEWHTFETMPEPLFPAWRQLFASPFMNDIKAQTK